MEVQTQAKFEGWAIVEMMGHQREIGFVTTEYYGAAALFRVDTPALEEREGTLKRPQYVDGKWAPAGSRIKQCAIPQKTRLVAPGSLYAITPCTEETARKIIDEALPRPLILLSIPDRPALLAAEPDEEEQIEQQLAAQQESDEEDRG